MESEQESVTKTASAAWINHEGEKTRREFLEVLASRRKGSVLLATTPAVNEQEKFFERKDNDCSSKDAPVLDSCPMGPVANSEQDLVEEHFFLATEAGEQGRVPVLLLRPLQDDDTKRPAVVFLHSTGRRKEVMLPYMQAFAARGYVTVAIDCRYHGERAASGHSYNEAIVSAWKLGDEMPFIFDTVWDVIKLIDYLSTRQDVDPARVGVLGISLGAMHAWFAAVADPRIAVVVPIIGVQSFSWAVFNEAWHARVQTIPHAFEGWWFWSWLRLCVHINDIQNFNAKALLCEAQKLALKTPMSVLAVAKEDLGKTCVDTETVTAVWQRIAPGLLDKFDAAVTIPAIAPRPLLIINGEQDPRCPVKGLEEALIKVDECYKLAGVPDHFQFKAEEGVGHDFIERMGYDASIWMDRFLKPDKPLRNTR